MKYFTRFFLSLTGFMLVLQFGFASQTFAQKPIQLEQNSQLERERLNRVMDSQANIEEFRQELNNYFMEMEDVLRLYNEIPVIREKFNKSGLMPLSTITEARRSIANMTTDDLNKMRAVYAQFPGWRGAPRALNSFIKPELRQQLETRIANKQNGGGVEKSSDVTLKIADNCQDGINANISNTDVSIAMAVVIATEGIMEALPTDFLSVIGHAVAAAAHAVARGVALGLQTLKDIKSDCESPSKDDLGAAKTEIINNDNSNKTEIVNNDNSNKTEIVNNNNLNTTTLNTAITTAKTDIVNNDNSNNTAITTAITNAKTDIINNDNSNKTTIINNDNSNKDSIVNNDNDNRTTIVNNDNTNKTTIINNDNANTTTIINTINATKKALSDLILRTQIEMDLRAENLPVIAWFMTPTVNGGHLDYVQLIVSETLANLRAANRAGGIGIADASLDVAQRELDKGNNYKIAGRYRLAYESYKKVYQATVNQWVRVP